MLKGGELPGRAGDCVDSFTGSALTPTDSKQEAYALIVSMLNHS